MNNKTITNIGILSLCIAGYCLFAIKGEVQDLNHQLNETTKQINEERNNINILKAEYAYLQSPNRIAKLVDKYLGLTSIKTDQMTKDPLIAEEMPEVSVSENVEAPKNNIPGKIKKVSWRYKNPKGNYLTSISQTKISNKR